MTSPAIEKAIEAFVEYWGFTFYPREIALVRRDLRRLVRMAQKEARKEKR